MAKTTHDLSRQVKVECGVALTPERVEEIAAQMNALGESVRVYADRATFEDEPAGFIRVLSRGKPAEDGK